MTFKKQPGASRRADETPAIQTIDAEHLTFIAIRRALRQARATLNRLGDASPAPPSVTVPKRRRRLRSLVLAPLLMSGIAFGDATIESADAERFERPHLSACSSRLELMAAVARQLDRIHNE